jgi:4-amino-4-deoxy-L-arabinose transferase-like glycosyltransferase
MTTTKSSSAPVHSTPSTFVSWLIILAVFATVFLTSLHTPALLDDADASHAQAAQHMAESGDWVTLKVDGIRYLEKAPLPYWAVAALYKVAGESATTTHLPNVLAILGCAWLGWLWAGRAWGKRAGLYAALGILTAIGPFLYTRFYIPEAILTFLLLLALYSLITGLESRRPVRFYGMWIALALLSRRRHSSSAFERSVAPLA